MATSRDRIFHPAGVFVGAAEVYNLEDIAKFASDLMVQRGSIVTGPAGEDGLDFYPTKDEAIDGGGQHVFADAGQSETILTHNSARIGCHISVDPDFPAAEIWVALKPKAAQPNHGQRLTAYGPPLILRGESVAGLNGWSDTDAAVLNVMDF